MIDKLKDVHGIGIRTIPLFSDILSKCNNLKIVGRHGVGYDSVDLKYLNENKIPLAVTGTSNAVSVAEHVLMMFLSSARRTIFADKLVKDGKFSEKTLVKKGSTIGANSTIICGLTIGSYSFIGAGSVVTKNVSNYRLVYGNPAKNKAWVSKNGNIIKKKNQKK